MDVGCLDTIRFASVRGRFLLLLGLPGSSLVAFKVTAKTCVSQVLLSWLPAVEALSRRCTPLDY